MVPPRFRLETAALHPERFLLIFSRVKDTLYQKRSIGDDDGDDFPLPEGRVPGRTALPEP